MKKEPICRSIDYSRLGVIVSKGLRNTKKGSTTFIRSKRGWVYKHKPSKEYMLRIEDVRFKSPGISIGKDRRHPRNEDRIYDEEERRSNNCAKLMCRIILKYNSSWE